MYVNIIPFMIQALFLTDFGMPFMLCGIPFADDKLALKNRGIPLINWILPWIALGILLMSLTPLPNSEQVHFKTEGIKLLATTAKEACPISIAICQKGIISHIILLS